MIVKLCDFGNPLEPPKPREINSDRKVAKKWLSGFPEVTEKWPRRWPQKWLFDPQSDSKVTFSGQKVAFGVTCGVALGKTPKVTF